MIVILILGVALSLGFLLSRSSEQPLAPRERIYLLLTPLPAVLALVLPSIIGLAGAAAPGPRLWSTRLTLVGAGLSAAMVVVGIVLSIQRSRQGLAREPRLAAGLCLAAIPLFLVAIIAVGYTMA